MIDDTTLRRLVELAARPGALAALEQLIEVQIGLESQTRIEPAANGPTRRSLLRQELAEREGPSDITISWSELERLGVTLHPIRCARRTREQAETDAPASRCAWLPEGWDHWRCVLCQRVETGTPIAREIQAARVPDPA